ncbi:MAG: hypothetical protein HYR80_08745, partial [Nitrospirae bacterium]|nr:hypothetical protein [Nitrospirota bacterium]
IQWPVGGSLEFSKSIENRYRELGGTMYYGQRVVKILVEDNQAVGIKLSDGSEYRADIIISNADGRKTIMNLLEGKFIDHRIKGYCTQPTEESNWAGLQIYLGVNRDLSKEPSALVMLLDKPVTIARQNIESLEMQIYGFDQTMAPDGKGVIKIELPSSYAYWKQLHGDKRRYEDEEKRVAHDVIELLERYFKGIKNQVEVTDVVTLMTWEQFMGGTRGFANAPNKKVNFLKGLFGSGSETTLPGLARFYFVGVWATSAGATFINALSGKKIIQKICKTDGKKFLART